MAILQAGTNQYRYSLQPGESLSITTDAASSCRYAQLASAPTATDMPSGGMIAVAASSTITIGQSSASRWLIERVAGRSCAFLRQRRTRCEFRAKSSADRQFIYRRDQRKIVHKFRDKIGRLMAVSNVCLATPQSIPAAAWRWSAVV